MLMKNLLIALLLLLTVAGCLPKKKDAVTPAAEPELAGSYRVSQLTLGATTVTFPNSAGSSATAVVSRLSDTQIGLIVNVAANGATTPNNFGTLTTKKASGQNYDVIDPSNNARIGTINGTDFTLDFTDGGQRFILISRK